MLAISWLSTIGLFLIIAIDTNGFAGMNSLKDWTKVIPLLIACYVIPQIIRKIIYWIIDGFRKS